MNTRDDFVLYRFFDAAGALLYIGVTARSWQRFYEHFKHSAFYPEVAVVTLQRGFADLAELYRAEQASIQSEDPRYNIARGYTPLPPFDWETPLSEWVVDAASQFSQLSADEQREGVELLNRMCAMSRATVYRALDGAEVA